MENEPRRRVVVTGIGMIASLGASVAKTRRPVMGGVSRLEDEGLYLEVAVRRR